MVTAMGMVMVGAEPGTATKKLWYLADPLGSVLGLVEKDGRMSARYHYDKFGVVLDAKKFDLNWPGPDNLFGYTSLPYEYYSGLTYARARYYQPEIGRFISEDTYKGDIWSPQSQNLYTYVWNNPLKWTDPSGNKIEFSQEIYDSLLNAAKKMQDPDSTLFEKLKAISAASRLYGGYFYVDKELDPNKILGFNDLPKITQESSKADFVYTVYLYAKAEEQRSGVPAAITTAQAILESGYGKSVPVDINDGRYSYNLFGIKGEGPAGSVLIWTTEYQNGKKVKVKDYFAAYNNFMESIAGRSSFLKENSRYSFLFNSSDPIYWADGLQKAGYATDPKYAQKLKDIMKYWDLK